MEIESTPVSGVEIINAAVAPLLAPCFLKPIETGTTPQEHSGRGVPISEAFSTEVILFVPRCFSTNPSGINILIIPDINRPNRINRAELFRIFQLSANIPNKISNVSTLMINFLII